MLDNHEYCNYCNNEYDKSVMNSNEEEDHWQCVYCTLKFTFQILKENGITDVEAGAFSFTAKHSVYSEFNHDWPSRKKGSMDREDYKKP